MSFPCVDRIYDCEIDNACSDIAYLDDYIYPLYWGRWPAYQPEVHKLNPDTYERIDKWLAPSVATYAEAICTDCEYLYAAMTTQAPTGQHHPIRVYKIDPDTMTTVASWQGSGTSGDDWASAIQFDFKTERLFLLSDRGRYRIYKLKQDLTEDMHIDAESGWPPSQYYGHDLTILGDYFYVATGGTPGEIVKRKTSDLSYVDYFSGYLEEPDDRIEGIFFNVCNDGEFIYTATYDYSECRPMRLIKIKPSDMSRWSTWYGQSDELMAYGSYYYGGRIYITNYGWNGIYWGEPGFEEGEIAIQINPETMTETDRYMNWDVDWAYGWKGLIGDGSRLHIGFSNPSRSVLQFAEEGSPECIPWVGNKVILSSSRDRYSVEKIKTTGIGDTGMLINVPNQKCFLPKVSIKTGDTCKITSFKDRHFARKI